MKFGKSRNRTTIFIEYGSSIEVKGYGEVVLAITNSGGKNKKLTLRRVALVPGAGVNLLSAKKHVRTPVGTSTSITTRHA